MSIISIKIAYALPNYQRVVSIQCMVGTTIKEAITLSKICNEFPEINLQINPVGVYGIRKSLNYVLINQDRIEIYRSLKISPTEARKLRAKSKYSS